MANFDMTEVFNAIATYYADEGEVELYGILNAFARAIEKETQVFVLARSKRTADDDHSFLMMRDEAGHVVFPLFTSMQELFPLKNAAEANMDIRTSTLMMDLEYLLKLLVQDGTCEGIIVNPDSQGFNIPIAFYEDVLQHKPISHITLMNADITDLYTDVIVSSSDEHLSGEGGVDAAILQAGGEVLQGAVQGEQLGVSDVLGFKAVGDLHSKYVFFTRPPAYAPHRSFIMTFKEGMPSSGSPIYSESQFEQELYNCYYHCMNVAQQAECTSIAFPCIGAGRNGTPIETVVILSTCAVLDWMHEHSDYAIDVYFCCSKPEYKVLYQRYFDQRNG